MKTGEKGIKNETTNAQDYRRTRRPEIWFFIFGRVKVFLFSIFTILPRIPNHAAPHFNTSNSNAYPYRHFSTPPFPDPPTTDCLSLKPSDIRLASQSIPFLLHSPFFFACPYFVY